MIDETEMREAFELHIASGWESTGSHFADMKHGFIAGYQTALTRTPTNNELVRAIKEILYTAKGVPQVNSGWLIAACEQALSNAGTSSDTLLEDSELEMAYIDGYYGKKHQDYASSGNQQHINGLRAVSKLGKDK